MVLPKFAISLRSYINNLNYQIDDKTKNIKQRIDDQANEQDDRIENQTAIPMNRFKNYELSDLKNRVIHLSNLFKSDQHHMNI